MALPLLYDCDPGNDTALAVLAAVGHPGIDLLAVTTLAGHLPAERTAHNAAVALRAAGAHGVPVARGSELPLVRDQVLAGVLDLDGGLDRLRDDLPALGHDPRHSVELIIDTARENPGLTVVTTGPLTNLASALRRDPATGRNIGRIISLCGAWGLGGKTAAAEFNVWCDPEAAAVVLGGEAPVTLLPVEATGAVPVDDALTERIGAGPAACVPLASELLASMRRVHRPGPFGPVPVPLHDPCAVLYAADPSLGETRTVRVDVELDGRHTYGRTVIDLGGRSALQARTGVVVRLDTPRTHTALADALARLPAPAAA
ncbi:nucleoside hydrolase [Streptomyces halstedii]|uniref:nucleoside hydrolase n=1 Tax=Streptomyces halstedii TaxID=1944 RepID=UPI0038683991|nr:nucleoside hydrolase [Streptomyces halstedii]